MFGTHSEPDHRRQLRDSVADFVSRSVDTRTLRADLASEAGFSLPRWREMASLGWTSVLLPEAFGGLEMEHGDLAALHVEIGRATLPEPLAIVPLLVGQSLALAGNRELADRVLPALVAGETVATLAWQGAPGVLGAADVGPEAAASGDAWRLSGRAHFVPCAGTAAATIVAARTAGGVALFWLDEMPPMTDEVRHSDGTRQATVLLDGISVGADGIAAGPDDGAAILETVLDTARLAAAAELQGLMERALEMTLDHLRERTQFGRPIGSFQALQHRAVDLFIQTELSRSALGRAAGAFDSAAEPATRAAQVSAAKSRCGDAARKVIKESIQGTSDQQPRLRRGGRFSVDMMLRSGKRLRYRGSEAAPAVAGPVSGGLVLMPAAFA